MRLTARSPGRLQIPSKHPSASANTAPKSMCCPSGLHFASPRMVSRWETKTPPSSTRHSVRAIINRPVGTKPRPPRLFLSPARTSSMKLPTRVLPRSRLLALSGSRLHAVRVSAHRRGPHPFPPPCSLRASAACPPSLSRSSVPPSNPLSLPPHLRYAILKTHASPTEP